MQRSLQMVNGTSQRRGLDNGRYAVHEGYDMVHRTLFSILFAERLPRPRIFRDFPQPSSTTMISIRKWVEKLGFVNVRGSGQDFTMQQKNQWAAETASIKQHFNFCKAATREKTGTTWLGEAARLAARSQFRPVFCRFVCTLALGLEILPDFLACHGDHVNVLYGGRNLHLLVKVIMHGIPVFVVSEIQL
jgi:hypothetical protein